MHRCPLTICSRITVTLQKMNCVAPERVLDILHIIHVYDKAVITSGKCFCILNYFMSSFKIYSYQLWYIF